MMSSEIGLKLKVQRPRLGPDKVYSMNILAHVIGILEHVNGVFVLLPGNEDSIYDGNYLLMIIFN